jgi:uncharacterized protein YozE (UPF0346 family)
MPTNIKMHLEFLSAASDSQSFTDYVSDERRSSDQSKESLAREMFAELRKSVSFADHWQALPDVGDLLESASSTTRPSDAMAFIDIFNVPALWLEISNTFTNLRYVLAQAKAYKDLEPPNSMPSSNRLCAYLHFEKMYRLNLAVFELVKIQDLVVRLLHESFSGKLISVDYDNEDWEKKLTLKDAKTGLKALAENGQLTDQEYQAILDALEHPSKSPHQEMVVRYRNRLTHRIRPSVDYPELYTDLQDRAGQMIKDASGKQTGRVWSIRGRSTKPDFLFSDLYTALAHYMSHVADMLKALKRIPRLS